MTHRRNRGKFLEQQLSRKGCVFNDITVLEYVSRKEGYKCSCTCGTVFNCKWYKLVGNKVRSCANCPRINKGRPLLDNSLAAHNSVYNRYKSTAARREISFELTEKQVRTIIVKPCYYCGVESSMESKLSAHLGFKYNGIDRVDSSEGYTIANCVPCCKICNTSKLNLPLKEWLAWIDRVYAHQHSIITTTT